MLEINDDYILMKTLPFDLCSAMEGITFASEKQHISLIDEIIN